jgi:hypothetical protein
LAAEELTAHGKLQSKQREEQRRCHLNFMD